MEQSLFAFEKLKVWQKGRLLFVKIYKITSGFPLEEKFGLTAQIRRASISVCSNLAEGYSRSSAKDKARFTEIAFGSLMEVLNQLVLAKDLGLIANEAYSETRLEILEISRMLNSLKKAQYAQAG